MTNDINPDALRQKHESEGFDESKLTDNPMELFHQWFSIATEYSPGKWFEPNAMTLSTSDGKGNISARIVLLKKVDSRGFYFFTNYASEKAEQIDNCPTVALTLHWPYLGRQIRIVGPVTKTDHETSETYFHSRARGSQIAAVASEQSKVLSSRDELEKRFAEIEQAYSNTEIPLPSDWGGYLLNPQSIEFWQGRENRMHDRFRYEKHEGGWTVSRLAP